MLEVYSGQFGQKGLGFLLVVGYIFIQHQFEPTAGRGDFLYHQVGFGKEER